MIRILIVDDSAQVRRLLRRALSPVGTIVAEAGDGYHVAELVERLRPDVVVVDFHMPTVSGVEATRQIKASSTNVAVVGYTGASASIRDRMVRAGAAAVFLKEDLRDLVEFVGQARLRA